MADKIKRWNSYTFLGGHITTESEDGDYVTYFDHQSTVAEATGLLSKAASYVTAFGGVQAAKSASSEAERKLRDDIDAFLSAHQECGGGST